MSRVPTLSQNEAAFAWSKRRAGWRSIAFALVGLWLLLLLVFHLFPGIDIALQRHFFEPGPCKAGMPQGSLCGTFPYAHDTLYVVLRKIFYYLPFAAAAYLIWQLVCALQHHGATYDRPAVQRMSILLGTLALGPVLFVNVWLKAYSGRPRPYQTELFGGQLPFVPAGSFEGLCGGNCSFVSGEAAGGSWLLCFILLLPPPLRTAVLPATIVISLFGPAMRVAFGRHFLSDIMLGWLSTIVIFALLCALFGWPVSPKSRDADK